MDNLNLLEGQFLELNTQEDYEVKSNILRSLKIITEKN